MSQQAGCAWLQRARRDETWGAALTARARAVRSRLSGSLVSSALFVACAAGDEPTSVLVEVQSDLVVGTELTEVRVQVFDRAGGNELSSRSIALTTTPGLPAQFELPASFALTPSERGVTDFRLVLTGRGPLGGGAVMDLVERQAIGTFVRHRQVALPMMLSRACLGVQCRGVSEPRNDLTCIAGECVSALATESPPSAPATPVVHARAAARVGPPGAPALGPRVTVFEAAQESPDERR